jgi:DNA-binding transcriptional regulator PaaX
MRNTRKRFYYKGVRTNILGLPSFSYPKENSKNKRSQYTKRLYNLSFSSTFKKDTPKNLIVMYDIPDNKKKERDWFRRHLKKFDYIMIQRSVWVGPSPLPKDFLDYVKDIGLKKQLKTFKLAKFYTGRNNDM